MRSSIATKPITHSMTNSEPLPIFITVASVPGLSIHSTVGAYEDAHRHCQPCHLNENNALVESVVTALTMLTTHRERRLLTLHRLYLRDRDCATEDELKKMQLRITIRTSSQVLIEAARYSREQQLDIVDGESATKLRKQLRRFDIQWQLLPVEAEELSGLRRWAQIAFTPGRAATCDGSTRQDCREALRTAESMAAD